MGQTTEIFGRARRFYKALVRTPLLDRLIRFFLTGFASSWARIAGFSFPEKFNWEWKFEMLSQRYERETVKLAKSLIKEGDVVLDIGAHVGYFTVLFAKFAGPAGRVLAFEPDPDNFRLLQKNTRRYTNVTIYNWAISDQVGEANLYHNLTKTGSHSLVNPVPDAAVFKVRAETLDNLMATGVFSHADIIKMDIEGAEPLAWAGSRAVREKNPGLKMIMEFSPANLAAAGFDPMAFFEELTTAGYVCKPVRKGNSATLTKEEILESRNIKNWYVNLLVSKNNPSAQRLTPV